MLCKLIDCKASKALYFLGSIKKSSSRACLIEKPPRLALALKSSHFNSLVKVTVSCSELQSETCFLEEPPIHTLKVSKLTVKYYYGCSVVSSRSRALCKKLKSLSFRIFVTVVPHMEKEVTMTNTCTTLPRILRISTGWELQKKKKILNPADFKYGFTGRQKLSTSSCIIYFIFGEFGLTAIFRATCEKFRKGVKWCGCLQKRKAALRRDVNIIHTWFKNASRLSHFYSNSMVKKKRSCLSISLFPRLYRELYNPEKTDWSVSECVQHKIIF